MLYHNLFNPKVGKLEFKEYPNIQPIVVKKRRKKKIITEKENRTCHQCKSKTNKLKIECCWCKKGIYCYTCLINRYSIKIMDVFTPFGGEYKQNPNWMCPKCFGFCNCASCKKINIRAFTKNYLGTEYKYLYRSEYKRKVLKKRKRNLQETHLPFKKRIKLNYSLAVK